MASVMNSGGPNGMHVDPSVSGMANTAGENNGGMSNADIVMAIFNAMNGGNGNGNGNMTAAAMHNSVSAAATAAITTPMSMDPSAGFDPSTFLLTQGISNSIISAGANIGVGANNNNNSGAGFGSGVQPMDWCFDWSLPTGLSNSMPHGDNVNVNDNDGDAVMSMDWSKSGAGGPSDTAARPGSTTRD
ncbi:hypothetical protein LPJ66_010037 [Kickxella alabastrina]|uniref:Uncharacterized protein n=1 Tax=Kickxella alabastrina TaxID=61397 RepID=A0ACC1I5F0_9FUNG|nr:hypothetical protein LPJ66_010037 [Kickxella alabastrina]